ncbi:MAG: Uma2 family endonuclease [Fimbriimonadales bacterium]|nr:Uma2 family endonuclease [Fimbriimonadales bacterium]
MTRRAMRLGNLKRVRERPRRMLAGEGLLTVDDYLRLTDEDDLYELIDGILMERPMAAVYPHEQLTLWMITTLRVYAEFKRLGVVLGSRSAVRISEFRARLPDVLFIRSERAHIITEQIILGAPDWVFEIRSRSNYPADWHSLEIDYRSIGVGELWLTDPLSRVVRVVRRTDAGYEAFEQSEGRLESTAIPGFWVETAWLFFDAERPSTIDALRRLGVSL